MDQFSIQFLDRPVLSLTSVLFSVVFYRLIEVSSCVFSLHRSRGILVSLLYAVIFNKCISLLEILQFISFQSNHCYLQSLSFLIFETRLDYLSIPSNGAVFNCLRFGAYIGSKIRNMAEASNEESIRTTRDR